MLARRLEIKIEQLRNKIASQLIELSRYSDVINRRKIERDGLRIEVVGVWRRTSVDSHLAQVCVAAFVDVRFGSLADIPRCPLYPQ